LCAEYTIDGIDLNKEWNILVCCKNTAS